MPNSNRREKELLIREVNTLQLRLDQMLSEIDRDPASFTEEGAFEPDAFQNHTALSQAKEALTMVHNNLNDLV